jgi:hypothetical protein
MDTPSPIPIMSAETRKLIRTLTIIFGAEVLDIAMDVLIAVGDDDWTDGIDGDETANDDLLAEWPY